MASHRPRRIVLLQIRAHVAAEHQEQQCFLRLGRLKTEELTNISLVRHPRITYDEVRGADAVFIGGAGEYSARHRHPFTDFLAEVSLRLIEDGVPFLGSCWGHQFLGKLLGGELVEDKARAEVGTYAVQVTEAGGRDPLFADLAPEFAAQLGHHDQLAAVPPGVAVLASSPLCPYQAFRLPGKPVYGTQFHIEMDRQAMRERLDMYRDVYAAKPGAYEAIAARLHPSPQADLLLRRFLKVFC
jgi:GMP synthase (glutamine-hydrolysing)